MFSKQEVRSHLDPGELFVPTILELRDGRLFICCSQAMIINMKGEIEFTFPYYNCVNAQVLDDDYVYFISKGQDVVIKAPTLARKYKQRLDNLTDVSLRFK